MTSPADVVSEQFSLATGYVSTLLADVTTFTNRLADAIYTTAPISITWTAIDPPSAATIPDPPAQLDDLLATLVWDQLGDIAGSKPASASLVAPDLAIDDFTTAEPSLTIPDAPSLDFGVAPTVDYGSKPVAPTLDVITVPDAPSITLPDAPTFLSLSTPSFAGLDLHADKLDALDGMPTLTLAAPTPYTYSPGPQYESTLLTTLKTIINSRLAGGTGLNPTVEQAIWDRARSRESLLGAANEAEVLRTGEALGYHLPPGVTAAQLRTAQQDTVNRISTASREIAIKQADLEQENLKSAVTTGIELEGKTIDYSYNMERLAFESAKEVAENAIQVHNAGVEQYKALLAYYTELRENYRAIIEGERLKLDEYRALLQAEQTKADVNKTLVDQYKATIEAQLAFIRIFEAQLGAAKVQVEIEQARVASFGEEIRAYVAGVQGETAKIEAYKINADAQKTRVDAYEAGVRGELARVEVFKALVGAYQAKVGGQGEKARANLAYYEGLVRSKTAEWEAWSARVRGEAERFRAITSMSNAVLDSFKAKAEVVLKVAEQDIRRWEIGIKQYEAQANYTIAAQKINTDITQANRQATLDAAKVGAAVYAQLTGSAMNMIHASAGVSGTSSMSVGYSYSNNTDSAPPSVETV